MAQSILKLALIFILSICCISCGVDTNSANKTQKFTYYNQVLSQSEIDDLYRKQEIHIVTYNEPINGIYGSVWNTKEEAQAENLKYMRDHGLIHSTSESEVTHPSESN